MNLLLLALVTIGAVSGAVTAILLVRRRAPDGSYFNDGDRAAGVFGVIATGFSVLLGFVVFLSFTSYDNSRVGAEHEALIVRQQFETAQYMQPEVAKRLGGELVCYARSVVNQEWPQLRSGDEGDEINIWGAAFFKTLRTVAPDSSTEETVFDRLLEQTSDREEARNTRIHGAEGIIPGPLWVILFAIGGLIVIFMLFFADSGEPAVVQGMLMGAVVAGMVVMFFVIAFLDDPLGKGYGSLEPTAMERTQQTLNEGMTIIGADVSIPCNELGVPISAEPAP
jgi:hypothetical protein